MESIDQIMWGKGSLTGFGMGSGGREFEMNDLDACCVDFSWKSWERFPSMDPWSDRQLYVNIIVCGFLFFEAIVMLVVACLIPLPQRKL